MSRGKSKLLDFENTKMVVLNGKAYQATLALETLAKEETMPDLKFLALAYQRRKRCIDRIEIVEMLGKVQSAKAVGMLKDIARKSSVELVRYYALRNLIENGISLDDLKPSKTYSSFWASLASYEEYRQDKISLEELRIRALPHAKQNDYNWRWLAYN